MNKFLGILKTIGVIIGFSGTVWIASMGYNNIINDISSVKEDIADVNGSIDDMNNSIDSLYVLSTQKEAAINDVKEVVRASENRLIYYIKHEGNMTSEQILDAFELGLDIGKKKELTVSDLLDGTP
jgi:hypothetical protein